MLNNILNGWRPATTKILIIALTLSVCFPVLAAIFQSNATWTCATSEEVISGLTSVDEELIITGEVNLLDSLMTIWANRSTGHWTIVVSGITADENKTSISCIVLSGKELKSFKAKPFI